MTFFYILIGILLVAVATYLFIFVNRAICQWTGIRSGKKTRIISGICAVLLAASLINVSGLPAIFVLHVTFIGMFADLLSVPFRLVSRRKRKVTRDHDNAQDNDRKQDNDKKQSPDRAGRLAKLYRCGLVPVLIALIAVGYGYYNMHHIVSTDYTIETSKTVAGAEENHFRIAFISDIHFPSTMDKEKLNRICKEVSAKKADVVILGGDIVDESTSKSDMEQVFKSVGAIKSTYGIYYVYGNHDESRYSADPNYTQVELSNALKHNHITVLQDGVAQLNGTVTLAGRNDISLDQNRKTPKSLLTDIDRDNYIIALDHQPKEYKAMSDAGADLLLSGHTHGGQVFPGGYVGVITGVNEMRYGTKKVGDMTAVVSSGLAGWGYPIKTQGLSEYVIIDIREKEAEKE